MLSISANNEIIKYCRVFDWTEYNQEHEENKNVAIIVIDANIGYNVFRDGKYMEIIDWFEELEDAIECAVERAFFEHSKHEVQEQKGNNE